MNYLALEKLSKCNEKICIFGAGKIGRTWAYDIPSCAGFKVDCYCDNKISAGTEIRDGVKTISFNYLCSEKENYLVFIAVNEKIQDEIKQQFEENGITNYIMMGFLFLQEFCESVNRSGNKSVLERYKIVVEDKEFLKKQFKYNVGYDLNIEKPKTFNEKLQWLKLYDRNPKYIKLVDKYELKKYITEVLGKKYIVPTIGIWNTVDNIEWDMLPEQFVIKCTHDSGSVIICKSKSNLNVEEAVKKLDKSMKRNFYWTGREWPYKNIRPRVIAETFLSDSLEEDLKDYKIHCFQGQAAYIQVDYDRFTDHKRNIYTPDWEYIDMEFGFKTDKNQEIDKPDALEEMIFLAEKLSVDIPYVRVDLYYVQGRIYIGEMTFYHGCGYEYFLPNEMGEKWGELIRLLD